MIRKYISRFALTVALAAPLAHGQCGKTAAATLIQCLTEAKTHIARTYQVAGTQIVNVQSEQPLPVVTAAPDPNHYFAVKGDTLSSYSPAGFSARISGSPSQWFAFPLKDSNLVVPYFTVMVNQYLAPTASPMAQDIPLMSSGVLLGGSTYSGSLVLSFDGVHFKLTQSLNNVATAYDKYFWDPPMSGAPAGYYTIFLTIGLEQKATLDVFRADPNAAGRNFAWWEWVLDGGWPSSYANGVKTPLNSWTSQTTGNAVFAGLFTPGPQAFPGFPNYPMQQGFSSSNVYKAALTRNQILATFQDLWSNTAQPPTVTDSDLACEASASVTCQTTGPLYPNNSGMFLSKYSSGQSGSIATPAGPVSNPFVLPSAPPAPTVVPVPGGVSVQWAAPAAGSAPVTGYTVSWNDYGPRSSMTVRGGQQAVILGLDSRISYQFFVAATSSVGTGPNSGTSRATPLPPNWISCATQGGTCASDHGPIVVRYMSASNNRPYYGTFNSSTSCSEVVFGDPSVGNGKTCSYVQAAALPAPPAALGSGYTFCAREGEPCYFPQDGTAVLAGAQGYLTLPVTGSQQSILCANGAFGSDPSPSSAKFCYFQPSWTTAPGPPVGLGVTPIPGGLGLTWGAPASGGRATSYTVTWQQTSGLASQSVTVNNGLPYTLTGLNPTSPYTLSVTANNSAGSSSPATAAAATPQPPTWTTCASDGVTCKFTGTQVVRYSATASPSVTYYQTATDSIDCLPKAFGGDPAYGQAKTCQAVPLAQIPAGPDQYTFCGYWKSVCYLPGPAMVAYGAFGSFYYIYVPGSGPNPVTCGAGWPDPFPGALKSCFFLPASSPRGSGAVAAPTGLSVTPGNGSLTVSWVGQTVGYSVGIWPEGAQTYGISAPGPASQFGPNANGMFQYVYSGVNPNAAYHVEVSGTANDGTQSYATSAQAQPGPALWTWCATEGGTCAPPPGNGPVVVEFASPGARGYTATLADGASVACGAAVLKSAPGYSRACYYSAAANLPLAPQGYTFCSYDGGACQVPANGYLKYGFGANLYGTAVTPPSPASSGSAPACSVGGFGDPAPGAPKACYSRSGVDLALGQPATQSSDLPWNPPTEVSAANAVDGNPDGNFFDGSVTHTNDDPYAWWQVDLRTSYTISSINIWNRTDCCGTRLSDYWVFVSNTPFSSSDTPASLSSRAGTWASHQHAAPNPLTSISTGGVPGRYVRVQVNGSAFLSLAEVEVFGQ